MSATTKLLSGTSLSARAHPNWLARSPATLPIRSEITDDYQSYEIKTKSHDPNIKINKEILMRMVSYDSDNQCPCCEKWTYRLRDELPFMDIFACETCGYDCSVI